MWMRIGNFLITLILHSPLHGMMSRRTLVIEYEGSRSGKAFAVPANYAEEGSDFLVSTSYERTWWRNFRTPHPASLIVRGRRMPVLGTSFTKADQVVPLLKRYVQKIPQAAHYFGIALMDDGSPCREDLVHASKERIMVRFEVQQRAGGE